MPFERDEVVIRRGLRTTSIERTLLDLAAIGEPIERLVAEAIAKRLTSIAKLRAYVAPFGPYTLDAVWPAAGLVVEIDTYETHGTRHSFEADRERDGYLLSKGLRTRRVTPRQWRERPGALRRQLAADLRQ